MEGVVVLSNSKALVSSHFVRPAVADLAIDAFLAAKRAAPSTSKAGALSQDSITSSSHIEPVIFFDAFDDMLKPNRSTNGTHNRPEKAKHRIDNNTYSVDSDESEEDSETSSDDDASDTGKDDLTSNAWATDARLTANSSEGTGIKPSTSYSCSHITHNGLHFLVPSRTSTDTAVAFTYLYRLIEILKAHLGGEVSEISLRENFDIVLQILSETFSAPGPNTTDAASLNALVPTSNIFKKVLNAGLAAAQNTSVNISASSTSVSIVHGSSFSSPLYWRREGIRYAQNEVYFDIKEDITALIDKRGTIVTGDVLGRVICKCKLSGMPDVAMSLTNPSLVEDPVFHPCVRLGRWTTSKTISFVPPDGDFELLSYRLATNTSPSRHSVQSSRNLHLPVQVQPIVTVGEVGGSFSICVSPPRSSPSGNTPNLESMVVSFYLGSNAVAVTGSISNGGGVSRTRVGGIGNGGVSPGYTPAGGSWEFDTLSYTLRWRIASLTGNVPTLSGTWTFDESKAKSKPSPFIQVSFSAPLASISGLGVSNLKVEGEKYSVYKGVRSSLSGRLEVRW